MSGERSTRACAAAPARRRVPAISTGPASLHIGIIWPSSAFGDDPVDVLGRVLDVAGLAVDAILRVDLEPRTGRLLDELIDSGRAISLLRPGIFGQVDRDRNLRVLER